MEKKNGQKKGGLSRIFELAESHKALLAVSGVLAALASIASFLPYISIYWITRDLLAVYPDFTNLDRKVIFGYGLLAVGGIAADALCFFSPRSAPILRPSGHSMSSRPSSCVIWRKFPSAFT